MLSNISFEDFVREEELQSFNDKESVAIGLLGLTKGLGKKQLQKLMFLSSTENNIILPFKFEKNLYGPYSKELEETINILEQKNIIEFSKDTVFTIPQETRKLTKEGEKSLENPETKIFSNFIKEIISNYEGEKKGVFPYGKILEKTCYDKFYLTKNETEEWKNSIKSKIQDILSLLKDRTQIIEKKEELEEKQDLILMAFDYMKNLLNKILEKDVDQVVKGVLIRKTEEYVDKWGEIILLDQEKKTKEEFNKILSEEKIIFKFINKWAFSNNVCDSVFEFELKEESQIR